MNAKEGNDVSLSYQVQLRGLATEEERGGRRDEGNARLCFLARKERKEHAPVRSRSLSHTLCFGLSLLYEKEGDEQQNKKCVLLFPLLL